MANNGNKSGKVFERHIANEFKDLGWVDAKRHLEYQIQEAMGIDLDNTDPFDVQCKNRIDYCLAGIDEISTVNSKGKRYRLLITNKKGRYPVLAVMYTEEFDDLFEKTFKLDQQPTPQTIDLNKTGTNRWRKYIDERYDCIIYTNLTIMKWEKFKTLIITLRRNNLI